MNYVGTISKYRGLKAAILDLTGKGHPIYFKLIKPHLTKYLSYDFSDKVSH